uniref:Uncharacterized protein n=1 Tax=Odontella aurita TaxID=265563 RepID=A0A6U6KX27_9STRA|mmetsp:Transcript_62982/g.186031  ORF Transcript_62982/g.186031 Transcript_62982/m.186031 type:complete len:380 (+) Transcript_62982:519-1658(+)
MGRKGHTAVGGRREEERDVSNFPHHTYSSSQELELIRLSAEREELLKLSARIWSGLCKPEAVRIRRRQRRHRRSIECEDGGADCDNGCARESRHPRPRSGGAASSVRTRADYNQCDEALRLVRAFLSLRKVTLRILLQVGKWGPISERAGPLGIGRLAYLREMIRGVDVFAKKAMSGECDHSLSSIFGFEFGRKNLFLLPLKPISRGVESEKCSVSVSGVTYGRMISQIMKDPASCHDMAQALFQLATLEETEWRDFQRLHAYLFRVNASWPPATWAIELWRVSPWKPSPQLLEWGKTRWLEKCSSNSFGGSDSTQNDDDASLILPCVKLDIGKLVGSEKARILRQGRGYGIPCLSSLANPWDGNELPFLTLLERSYRK